MTSPPHAERKSFGEILLVFLRLGLTSFGGPVAHVGYFREEFVERKRWLGEKAFASLVALCQFLPGPTSSQIGLGVGLAKGGVRGALAAWLGFTLPSAIAMAAFGWLVLSGSAHGVLSAAALHGLKVAAVAVVANALAGMARSLCPTIFLSLLALTGGVIAYTLAGVGGQLIAIAVGGLGGYLLSRVASPSPAAKAPSSRSSLPISLPARVSLLALVTFVGLLLVLPPLARVVDCGWLGMADSFYRTGSLVFGGGHVVLPLLQAEVVPPVDKDVFLAGYGAAQAVPGPMFTFASYLGTVMPTQPGGWIFVAGALCLVMIFLPGFLMILGVLPFWSKLSSVRAVKSVVTGINAGVVGLLGAAFINPVFSSGVRNAADLGLALAGFVLLLLVKAPAWLVVLILGSAYAAWSAWA